MKGIILQQGIINKYGLEAAYVAAVLGQILVAKKGNDNEMVDNKHWVFGEIEWLKETYLKELSLNKVKKIIKELESNNILEVKRVNGVKGITINYKVFFKEAEEGMQLGN